MAEVYLFPGPEIGAKKTHIDSLIGKISEKNAVERHSFYGGDNHPSEAVHLLKTPSLFGERTIVVFYNIDLITKKNEKSALAEYCKNPLGDGILILCSDDIRIDKSLDSTIPKERKKVFWELFENQKKGWLIHFFKEHGKTIAPDAIETFLELVENNTEALSKAGETLLFTCGGEPHVTSDMVETALYHSKDENVFTLFSKMAHRDVEEVLDIWTSISAVGKEDPSRMTAVLYGQFTKLLSIKTGFSLRFPFDEAASKVGIRNKKAKETFLAGCNSYTIDELKKIIDRISLFDLRMRQSAGKIKDMEFQFFLYQCTRR